MSTLTSTLTGTWTSYWSQPSLVASRAATSATTVIVMLMEAWSPAKSAPRGSAELLVLRSKAAIKVNGK